MRHGILLLFLCTGTLLSLSHGGPVCNLHPLYPYGDGNTKTGDDDHAQLVFSKTFNYYGLSYTSIHISTNGQLSFGGNPLQMVQEEAAPYPIPYLASYWNDHDIISPGILYYKEVDLTTETGSGVLAILKADIQKASIPWGTTTMVVIVTWSQVGRFGAAPGDDTVTHQIVLATDGSVSVAVLNYGNIGWNKVGDFFAAVSFNKGVGAAWTTFNISKTAEMSNLGDYSNINHPGRIVVRVDNTIVLPTLTNLAANCNKCSVLLPARGVTTYDGNKDYVLDAPNRKYLWTKTNQPTEPGALVEDDCKFMSRYFTTKAGAFSSVALAMGVHPSDPRKYKRNFVIENNGVVYRGHGVSSAINIVSFPHYETMDTEPGRKMVVLVQKYGLNVITVSSPQCKFLLKVVHGATVEMMLGPVYSGKTMGMCQNNNDNAADEWWSCSPEVSVADQPNRVTTVEDSCSCDLRDVACNDELKLT